MPVLQKHQPESNAALSGLCCTLTAQGKFPVTSKTKICSQALAIALTLTWSVPGMTDEKQATKYDDQITVTGKQTNIKNIAGAVHQIDQEVLSKFSYSDVQSILRAVPGLSLQVEDGYGLRPNISIRGVSTERSGRITLLEDNVLIAPAPYSAPSAYYFPTPGRMHAFEVLKGPAAITQGPYTVGGALNMISTPIPETPSGMFMTEGGEDATYRVHAYYGGNFPEVFPGLDFLIETHQWVSDGFQDIDRSNGDTGLWQEDYTLKLRHAPADSRHQVDFKFQYAAQNSDQSYLGLTDADFARDSYRRYGVSAKDNIQTKHFQYILNYKLALNNTTEISAVLYNNTHERNWFKSEGLDPDGSVQASEFKRTSWFNVIQALNRGEGIGGLTSAELQGILDGTEDTPDGSIQLRSNAREYYSRGMQVQLNWNGEIGPTNHVIEVAARYHRDQEDRLQRNSTYHQEGGQLVLDDLGELGNAGNRVQRAGAFAFHIQDHIAWQNWIFSPGVRYENISQKRTRWRDRGEDARARNEFRDSRKNKTEVWLPGVGILYMANDKLIILGGVHKGFTAPSNAPDVKEEEAINYEFGFRYNHHGVQLETIGFLSDYDNILGECTSSSGTDCTVGDAFNGDAATVLGAEVLLATDLAPQKTYKVPFSIAYTYMDATFDSDIADTDFFGDVSNGDPIPYIPSNQFRASLGLEYRRWMAHINANYVGETCVRASCGSLERTDAVFTVDLAGQMQINDTVEIFGRMENLTGTEDIVSRHPYGARPGKSRTFTAGLRYRF